VWEEVGCAIDCCFGAEEYGRWWGGGVCEGGWEGCGGDCWGWRLGCHFGGRFEGDVRVWRRLVDCWGEM